MNVATCFASCVLLMCHEVLGTSRPSFLATLSKATLPEDGKLNFTQLASKYGHKAEQFDVITEDAYILTLFHLPGHKPPVLLFHGIADTADTFIIRGNTSLAITLAEAGYDVWVGNGRGNRYARRHINLNPDTDKKFWDYSFHESGYFDLAATIDFICEKAGTASISSVTHSQGSTLHYVLTSLRPAYNEKIKVSIAMAPIAFMNHLIPPVSLVALAGPVVNAIGESLGIDELFQDNKATRNFINFVCSKGLVSFVVCELGVLLPFSGFNPFSIEPEFTGVLFAHFPAGTSRKSFFHFNQIALRRSFSQFVYGVEENFVKYGGASPPDYDLSAVKFKAALLVGNNDELSRVKDAEQLRDSLPNVVHYEVLKPKLWSHGDFVNGLHMTDYLYPSIFKILEKYN